MKPNNVIHLKCTATSFYKAWMEFLTPFHKLTARERELAARILAQYFKLKESITDSSVLREVLWSYTSKRDMRDSLGLSQSHFQIILGKLKQAGFLIDGDINPKYIPDKTDDPRFVLSIIYDWSSPQNPITPNSESGKKQD